MSDYIELVVAGLGGSGKKSTAVNFTVVDGIRTWAWIANEIVTKQVVVGQDKDGNNIFRDQIRAGVTLTVQDVRALGDVQTQYEKDGEIFDLVNPKQQLLLGGQMTITQPVLEPMAKLEVVSA